MTDKTKVETRALHARHQPQRFEVTGDDVQSDELPKQVAPTELEKLQQDTPQNPDNPSLDPDPQNPQDHENITRNRAGPQFGMKPTATKPNPGGDTHQGVVGPKTK